MLTLEDYEKLVKEKTCRWCGGHLGAIEYYDHSAGWIVKGFQKRQWLYKTCLKCSYQWALWKIGVSRNAGGS